jgi:hypothetical protein
MVFAETLTFNGNCRAPKPVERSIDPMIATPLSPISLMLLPDISHCDTAATAIFIYLLKLSTPEIDIAHVLGVVADKDRVAAECTEHGSLEGDVSDALEGDRAASMYRPIGVACGEEHRRIRASWRCRA